MSKHLKTLEEDYKIKLFTRYAKGIRLTDQGREFIRDVEPILAQLEKLNQHYLNGSSKIKSGRLKIGGTYGPSSRILPSLLAVFKKKFPHVDVNLRSNSNGAIHNSILNGELEIAVTSRMPHSSLLYAEPYLPMKRVAFAAKDDPLAKKKALKLSDLENIPLIIRNEEESESSTCLTLNALRKQGYKLNIAMRCESPEAIKMAVKQRFGIGLLIYDAVRSAIERGTYKIVQIRGLNMEGQSYIVYHHQRELSPNAQEFLKLLRQWRDSQTAKKATEQRKVHSLSSLVPLLYAAYRLSPSVSHAFHFSRHLLVRI